MQNLTADGWCVCVECVYVCVFYVCVCVCVCINNN